MVAQHFFFNRVCTIELLYVHLLGKEQRLFMQKIEQHLIFIHIFIMRIRQLLQRDS